MRMVIGRVIRGGSNGYLLSSCLNRFQVLRRFCPRLLSQ